MLIILKDKVSVKEINYLTNLLKQMDFSYAIFTKNKIKMLEVEGVPSFFQFNFINSLDFVDKIITSVNYSQKVYKNFKVKDTIIEIKNRKIGGDYIEIIAGPCAVESVEQTERLAKKLSTMGIKLFRGGAYKPRTSPYSFQGLNLKGLKILNQISKKYDLAIVTELLDVRDIDVVYEYADIIQIGTRNSFNYPLLKEVGKINKPILLKRGFCSTIKEFLSSAEYIISNGNLNVILCERGIKTFETEAYRSTFDISAVAILKEVSHLPIISDPSHSSGAWNLVEKLSLASICCGANGVMLEVHDMPHKALSDAKQSLMPDKLKKLIENMKKVTKCLNKKFM